MDLGEELASTYGYDYKCYGVYNDTRVVIRTAVPITLPSGNFLAACQHIYVPADNLQDYKTAWSSLASYLFAIGGSEWVEDFGSTSEFANLTTEEYESTYGLFES